MIGINYLGKRKERLANQMFQYAAVKGIAANCGYNYCIPPSNFKDSSDEWEEHQLLVPFKLQTVNPLNVQYIDFSRPVIQESGFCFDQNLFNSCPDWVCLVGYFQTEKYFINVKNELKQDFAFKDEIHNPCVEAIRQIENPISLHVRRTDYVTNPNHTTLSLDYYEEALSKFDSDRNVLVFSDDPIWCKNQSLFSSDRFFVSEGNSNYTDLCLMTLCSDHIIANSSFSWWGAWLSENNEVVAPSGWFRGTNLEHLDTVDLLPETWEII
jgi:hypothetical protein